MTGFLIFFCASQPYAFVAKTEQHNHYFYTLFDGTVIYFSNFAFAADAVTNLTLYFK